MADACDHDLLDYVKTQAGRLMDSFEECDGCWLWLRGRETNGYGQVHAPDGRTMRAHRAMWMLHHDRPIPIGMTLDHLCRVRRCVNPEHLEPVTFAENVRRAALERDAGANIRERLTVSGKPRYAVGYREIVDGKLRQRTKTFGTLEAAEEFRRQIIESRPITVAA